MLGRPSFIDTRGGPVVGLFSSKKSDQAAARWAELARDERQKERTAARKAAERRGRLDKGTSQDREADRYLAQEAEADRRIAAANARDFEASAKRRRWF